MSNFLEAAAGAYVQPYNENGPASAPTLPDHGSTNPEKDMDMNKHMNTTAAAETASVKGLYRLGKTHIDIDTDALRKCGANELWLLRAGLHTLANVIGGLLWNSYMEDEAGAHILSQLQEFICGYEAAAVNAAISSEPATKRDAQWREWIILGYAADCADNLTDFAVSAAKAVRNEDVAAFRERRVS